MLKVGQLRKWAISDPPDHLANGIVFRVVKVEGPLVTAEYEEPKRLAGYETVAAADWMAANSSLLEEP